MVDAIRLFAHGPDAVEGQPSSLQGIDRFWHYTDARGLLGIAESSELWASGINQMNDPEEIGYSHSLLSRVWREDFEPHQTTWVNAQISAVLSLQIRNALLDSLHVVSACRESDNLAMWHHYGSSDGFAIGMSHQHLSLKSRAGVVAEQRTFWERVIYERVEQRTLAVDLFKTLLQVLPTPEEVPSGMGPKQKLITLLLAIYIAAVKHPAYAHEQEVRGIVTGCTSADRRYRVSERGLTSFVRLVGHDSGSGIPAPNGLGIDEVMCGPTVTTDRARVVADLLQATGIGAQVLMSEVPFRG